MSNLIIRTGASKNLSVSLTRAAFVGRGVRGGAALVVAGGVVGVMAETASADPISDQDLAYVRLLITAELLASNFYTQAMAASNTSGGVASYLKRAYFNEQEHYQSVAGILSGAGETPQVSADVDFSYPAGTFDSEASILKAAAALENTVAGAYAGAMGGIVTNQFKSGLAQIALCEAQHASYFAVQSGGKPFWLSFPAALTIQQASDAMNQYTS